MKTFFIFILIGVSHSGFGQVITSPNKTLTLQFRLTEKGEPTYQLMIRDKKVTEPSVLGLELKDQPAMAEGFALTRIDTILVNEKWNPVWGEVKVIVNNYRELTAHLQHVVNF